jgi:hypothetical protein
MSYTTTYSRQTVRSAKFSKNGSSSVFARGDQPLTLDQLRHATPSVFAEQKHESRSERYSYIPTSEILVRLQQEGFEPFAAFQGGSKDEEKKGFTKHLIRLRHMGAQMDLSPGEKTVSEIVLLNSHDGTSSYKMIGGQFVMVCANGLITSNDLIQEVRVTHSGDVARHVIDGCIQILDAAPRIAESVEGMRSLELSREEQGIFARAALLARYDDAVAPVSAAQVLEPNRREDVGNSLWKTFNRVQENIINGGLRYDQRDGEGRLVARRSTRPIRGIDGNTAVNRALWQLAEEMRALRA